MANVWEQLICQTCGSNAVEIVDGLLCCKACKSKHTLQEKISEEEVIALNRAASYRNRLAFDDAFDEYTELLKKHPDNEAANWGAFLSFYGIVYEKDTDGKYIPTCHRLSEKPVESSAYYYHFGAAHKAQAEEIEKLRVAIMDKAKKIQPYDVFICYKATEERFGMSMPTKEAAWARDVYDMLTHELKLRVFFAEKSLQGSNIEYEPHIYSALNSAKLMLVLTTGIENVNATWVKNEWKRFSHYIKEGQDKTIRVVYDGIQPYDLPQELQKTQAIDHNAMGWDKAVRQAAESVFAVKEEKPEWQKAMEEMQAKMSELQTQGTSASAPTTAAQPSRSADKYCAKCGAGNVKNAKFCADCAHNVFAFEFKQYCLDCGTKMDLLKKFCPSCGKNKFVYTKEDYQKEEIAREFDIENGVLKKYKGNATEVVISNIVKNIGENAFKGCSSLTSVIIPDSVTSIDDSAFEGCRSLTSITIPDSVTSIGSNAFLGCRSLTSITIPDSVTSIGSNAFLGCTSLTSITIPAGVTSIGESSFTNCDSLTRITVDKNNKKYKEVDGNLYSKDGKTLLQYAVGKTAKSFTILDSVTSIDKWAFSSCKNLTSVVIPDSVTSIGGGAFSDCDSLTSITIPDSVTSIGNNAFYKCNSLTSITIPDSITSIGDYAFRGCTSLTSITIPDSVTSIGAWAFKGCSSLTSITIPDSVTSIGYYAFDGCSSLTSITIPDGVTSIGEGAFNECTNLTSVEIGDSVTSIDNSAFKGCTNLTSVTIGDSVTSIGGLVFSGRISLTSIKCSAGICIKLPKNSLQTVEITSGEEIPEKAFYNCKNLTSITIPDSVTSIGDYAFDGCSSLTSITIPDSVTSISKDAFAGCNNLTIYARAEMKPKDWHEKRGGFLNLKVVESWNPDNRPVVWGYKGETK